MRIKSVLLVTIVALVLISVRGTHAQSEPRYTISISVQLELPEHGYTTSSSCTGWEGIANDINDSGEVVGFWPKDETRGNAFHYDGERMRTLKGGSGGSEAKAINNTGAIVGALYRDKREYECDPGLNPIPALWQNGEVTELALPEGAESGVAFDVNDDGIIVGTANTGRFKTPVVWIDGEPIVPNMALPEAFVPIVAEFTQHREFWSASMNSIDDAGNVYGSGDVYDTRGVAPTSFAVKWSSGDYQTEVIGAWGSAANSGSKTDPVGTALNAEDDLVAALFIDGKEIELPSPAGLENLFRVYAIETSADGSLIVGTADLFGDSFAYLWTVDRDDPSSSTPVSLESVVDELGDLHITYATGINAGGRILAIASDAAGVRSFVILDPVAA